MTIIENMNRAKSRFFEKINKMDKTLFSLTQNTEDTNYQHQIQKADLSTSNGYEKNK